MTANDAILFTLAMVAAVLVDALAVTWLDGQLDPYRRYLRWLRRRREAQAVQEAEHAATIHSYAPILEAKRVLSEPTRELPTLAWTGPKHALTAAPVLPGRPVMAPRLPVPLALLHRNPQRWMAWTPTEVA